MVRRVFRFVYAMSLLLCVATVAIWVRSRFVCDSMEVHLGMVPGRTPGHRHYFTSARGTLEYAWGSVTYARVTFGDLWHGSATGKWDHCEQEQMLPLEAEQNVEEFPWPAWTHWGFHWSDVTEHSTDRYITVSVPYWCPSIVFAFCPALAIARALPRRIWRRSAFACRHCGYDLRATPDRCPECGTVVGLNA